MVGIANAKLGPLGGRAEVAAAEDMQTFAERHFAASGEKFEGAFSNFAPLNCVVDLSQVAAISGACADPHSPRSRY
jgi:hypothetical protein